MTPQLTPVNMPLPLVDKKLAVTYTLADGPSQ